MFSMHFPFKMLSWNVRGGFGKGRKQRFSRFLNRKYGFSFLGIVETKREQINDFLVRRLWVKSDFDYSFVPSKGRSAGLCLIWNSKLVSNSVVQKGARWISLSFTWSDYSVKVILVYAPNDVGDRQLLWDELYDLLIFDGPIILIGDFNEICTPNERRNYPSYSLSMQ